MIHKIRDLQVESDVFISLSWAKYFFYPISIYPFTVYRFLGMIDVHFIDNEHRLYRTMYNK